MPLVSSCLPTAFTGKSRFQILHLIAENLPVGEVHKLENIGFERYHQKFHPSLFQGFPALPMVAARAGRNDVVPSVGAALYARHDMVAAADSIQQWSREASPEQASLVDPQQIAILSQMRAVRANMLQWEGYQEVVTMLRAIIHLQKELQSEAKRALQDQASEVFDD